MMVQVGACIVNDEHVIVSIGYNGFPRGCHDHALPWAKKASSGSLLDTKYPYVSLHRSTAACSGQSSAALVLQLQGTSLPCARIHQGSMC